MPRHTKHFFDDSVQFHGKGSAEKARKYIEEESLTDAVVWAADEPPTARGQITSFFIASDVSTMGAILATIPIECRTMYEMIPPNVKVKPYIDIDWYIPNTGKHLVL